MDSVGCVCDCYDNQNVTLEEKLQEIRTALYVNKKTLSSTKRKLISAGDERPSAASIGYFGMVLLCLVGLVLIVPDIFKALHHIIGQCSQQTSTEDDDLSIK